MSIRPLRRRRELREALLSSCKPSKPPMATQPTVKWAQRKDRLFLTIDIQDITEENVVLTAEKVSITGKVSPESLLRSAPPRGAPRKAHCARRAARGRRAVARTTPSTLSSPRRWTRRMR